MIKEIVFEMLKPGSLIVFFEVLCAPERHSPLSFTVGNFILFFTSVSVELSTAWSEGFGSPQVFLVNIQPHSCVWPSRFSRFGRTLSAPYGCLFSNFSFWDLFFSHPTLFVPSFALSNDLVFKQFLLVIFNSMKRQTELVQIRTDF